MRSLLLMLSLMAMSSALFAQTPPIEPGVSQELARWRAARYSDVRYKLNLTLEKMSPVLKGTMEIRVRVGEKGSAGEKESVPPAVAGGVVPIVLDWRKIKGHEDRSTISNVSINGKALKTPPATAGGTDMSYAEENEHLIFRDGVVVGENVIKLDFTSPILPSGSAITRYVDKEDGSEYIYSLFVPSDASTAFPVFDQPDLKARFQLTLTTPQTWQVVSNTEVATETRLEEGHCDGEKCVRRSASFRQTVPISSYVFAFSAGDYQVFRECAEQVSADRKEKIDCLELGRSPSQARDWTKLFVRKSQAAKVKPHASEVFRLNREAVKYFEQYFDYKFPFPKYDLVLIPEFPFGGMEHAGATFLRESAIIFPQEPTKNDLVNRATLIFHEAAHQWFGDTVTMRWFDDLWLKEGFATFTAYKALEKIMPEMNAWKVFYERIKQGAYQTDATKGTTAIYQPIANLSAAKSAYGNIVYNKAPAFLRQAEFYLGEDKFQTAVRAFLKKHEFGNAGWEDLVKEFGIASSKNLGDWANIWVKQSGLPTFRLCIGDYSRSAKYTGHPGEINLLFSQTGFPCYPPTNRRSLAPIWPEALQFYYVLADGKTRIEKVTLGKGDREIEEIWGYSFGGLESKSAKKELAAPKFVFTNYSDYGYGIFLLDEKSREYVLKNIQNEKDPFLRAMMWGALWDSVHEGELDPRVFVELVVKVLGSSSSPGDRTTPSAGQKTTGIHPSFSKEGSFGGKSYAFTRETDAAMSTSRRAAGREKPDGSEGRTGFTPEGVTLTEEDESTVATLLGRTGTALNYYMSVPPAVAGGDRETAGVKAPPATAGGTDKTADLRSRVEDMLIERMRNAPSLGQRITYYRAFLNIASSEKGRTVLKDVLNLKFEIKDLKLKTKDKFDIVTRLLILGDPDAPKLLADLEKAETSDDAKRYAYAARAGIGTAENKAKYWNDFVNNKEISESWIEAAFGPWNSIRHSELTLPYLQKALQELPNHKRNRKIFFVNGWLGAFIGGQRGEEALGVVNKFLADNPKLDNDLRLKILENVDVIERAVRIRGKN